MEIERETATPSRVVKYRAITEPPANQTRSHDQSQGRPAPSVCAIGSLSRALLAANSATSMEVAVLVLLLLLLLLPSVVAMEEVVMVVVAVEVEDGPALEKAGVSTAPTPGFVPTTSPVDNATATPGSFRLFSFSLCLSHCLSLSFSIRAFLPLFVFSTSAQFSPSPLTSYSRYSSSPLPYFLQSTPIAFPSSILQPFYTLIFVIVVDFF